MALDKAIKSGKEHRKPYRGSKSIDATCRNHGGCPWCEENRKHKFRDKDGKSLMDDFLMNDSYDAYSAEYEEKMQLLKEVNESDELNYWTFLAQPKNVCED